MVRLLQLVLKGYMLCVAFKSSFPNCLLSLFLNSLLPCIYYVNIKLIGQYQVCLMILIGQHFTFDEYYIIMVLPYHWTFLHSAAADKTIFTYMFEIHTDRIIYQEILCYDFLQSFLLDLLKDICNFFAFTMGTNNMTAFGQTMKS